ncbi:hypothetical protein BX070DRAFT_220556 [Coemansia spiralis]|nr:hypothetical protein BX070DRAFT_220556 [Coemansia spiralis]
MTKASRQSRRSTGASKRRVSAAQSKTSRKGTKRQFEEDSDENDENGDGTWDFDAPKYYDFANTKTPGAKAEKWFDYTHPTPAPRKSKDLRLSSISFLSTDSRKSLLPNRPSLSPSRIVVEADGKLKLDADIDVGPQDVKIEEVEFSNTDEEIEFNEWRRAHSLPESDTGYQSSQKDDASANNSDDDNEHVSMQTTSTTKDVNSSNADKAVSSSVAAVNPIANNLKETTHKNMASSAFAVPERQLTVPVELGFMRPTKVVSRRLSMKKRDKANQRAIATAIANSINRRLSQENTSSLTIPRPFKFHETRRTAYNTSQAADSNAEASVTTGEVKLSKKAQDYLISKLTARHKAADSVNENIDSKVSSEHTPPKKAVKKFKPTVPKTPQFAKSKRARRELPETKVEPGELFKAKQPKKLVAGQQALNSAKPSQLKPTVVQPFTFRSDAVAERHLLRLREEITKLKAEEQALRQFRANPLPGFPTPKKVPRKSSTLHASPFNLATDIRGETYQRQLRERIAELEHRRRERMLFKARPIPTSIDHPFVPQPSSIPLTSIEEILLHTELRSEERHAYDEDRMERERIREEVLARKRQEEERREEEEIKELRKLLVHKAQPVRHYKPVIIKASDHQLTVPKTPKWSVRTRQRPVTPTSPTQ